MKTNLFKLFALMVVLLIGGGSMVMNAAAVSTSTSIPMKRGEYVNLSTANSQGALTIDKASIETNDVYSVGSTSEKTKLTFKFKNSTAGDYLFSFRSGTTGMTVNVNVEVTCGTYKQNSVFFVPNTGSWSRVTLHNMILKNLPQGDVTLVLTVKDRTVIDESVAHSYAGNYGYFSITSINDYDKVSLITLSQGTYSASNMYETAKDDVGSCKNGCTAEYIAYNDVAGAATLNIGLNRYGNGHLNLTITDIETGKTEVSKEIEITTDNSLGLDKPTSFEVGSMTKGLKSIKFEVVTTSSYLCNYKNLGFTVAPQATVGETGFATIGFPCAVTLPEGVKAYAITSVNNNTVTLTQVNNTAVAANTGLIICAKPGTYTFAQATEGDVVADNKLVANTDAEKVAETEQEFYVLGVTDATKKTVGMMPIAANGTVGQYKAYLPATEVTSLAKGLKIVFGDQATAISEVEANGAEATSNAAYNVLGQRVNGNAKGIVIINGKKYIK